MTPSHLRCALPVVIAGLLAGCDADEPDDELALRDARAVVHGSDSLEGAPRLAYFGALFVVPPGLDPGDPEAVRRDTVAAVHQRLVATFAAIGCEAELDTDGEHTVGMSLQGCRLLAWTLDADVEAHAEVETAPCETGTCATAVVWDVDIGTLSTRRGLWPPTGFAGPAILRAPVDPAEPLRWDTQPGFVLETRLGLRFEALTRARWTVDEDDCVELELGSRLALEERDDALDEQIGDVVVSVRGLRRCPERCPEAGRVELSFAAGAVLAWEHDGSDTVTVQGPRGRSLEARLPCAEERGASE